MRIYLYSFFICIILFFAFSSCKKEIVYPTDPRLIRMEELADSIRNNLQTRIGVPIPGMHFYIQSPNGNFFISSAATPNKKITSDYWLRFASVTKVFTSAAILNMAEDGWLNIDDTITENIPGSSSPYVPNTSAWNIPYKSQITIRQIMSHTAGIFDADNDVVPSLGQPYTDYMEAINPTHTFTTDQYTNYLSNENLSYFSPGSSYHYSNTGYSILSVIIGRVYSVHQSSTKSYANYMNEVLLPSVPSASSYIRFPDQATDQLIPQPGSNGFIYNGGSDTATITNYNPTITIGEGNGQGTMKAVHDWIRSYMKGTGPVGNTTIQLLNTPLVPDHSGSQYTYGTEVYDGFGRGHTGARAGNLCLFSYNESNDISVFAYFPFWDLTNGRTSLLENGLLPLFIAADLLVEASK